jgi:hypothetical protein
MKSLAATLVVLLSSIAFAQLPDAPIAKVSGSTDSNSQYFLSRSKMQPTIQGSKTIFWLSIASSGIALADASQTCYRLHEGNFREEGLPTQNCGVASILLIGQAIGYALAARELHRVPWFSQHKRTSTITSIGLAIAPGIISGNAIRKTYTSKPIVITPTFTPPVCTNKVCF